MVFYKAIYMPIAKVAVFETICLHCQGDWVYFTTKCYFFFIFLGKTNLHPWKLPVARGVLMQKEFLLGFPLSSLHKN